MSIYYMYDAVTKQFIGEVQAPNQPINSTELPPVRNFNGKTYNLQDPVWDGTKWTGSNKDLDLLDLIDVLSIQMGQHEVRLAALEGGDTEDV
ncbi:hypothetical protein [uncultured Lactobacillus sp.]|uniref:hypothetical protein n=1 Tax=uncultured Lactobacillus sp. TaxID=153152 RepID=UPI00263871FD|nr:hypothetical protein [uncultured Lactobacillus sp.]